jgi:hypothetical protein
MRTATVTLMNCGAAAPERILTVPEYCPAVPSCAVSTDTLIVAGVLAERLPVMAESLIQGASARSL